MNRKIFWLCVVREFLKVLMVGAMLMILLLPEAWATGGVPMLLVLLAMLGCAALALVLYDLACWVDRKVYEEKIRREQLKRFLRKLDTRAWWKQYFRDQEKEL